MNPFKLPSELCEKIKAGTLVALNIGQPPLRMGRIYIAGGRPAQGVPSVGSVPDLDTAQIIGVAITEDFRFVDLVWVDAAEALQVGVTNEARSGSTRTMKTGRKDNDKGTSA